MKPAPHVLDERSTRLSPWVTIVERTVAGMPDSAEPQTFHALRLADYVAIVARTSDGLYPMVRQFRPAVNQFTWELPAGTVDAGEPPEAACDRELMEEVGLGVLNRAYCGSFISDSGRIDNRLHVFAVLTPPRATAVGSEPGLEIDYWTDVRMDAAIRDGSFVHMLHVGAFLLARPFLDALSTSRSGEPGE